jgi:hypothetical protein
LTSSERFPSGSTVGGDLRERLLAQRFPVFAVTEEVTGSNPVAPTNSPVEQGFCRYSRTADALEQVAASAPSAGEHFPV